MQWTVVLEILNNFSRHLLRDLLDYLQVGKCYRRPALSPSILPVEQEPASDRKVL